MAEEKQFTFSSPHELEDERRAIWFPQCSGLEGLRHRERCSNSYIWCSRQFFESRIVLSGSPRFLFLMPSLFPRLPLGIWFRLRSVLLFLYAKFTTASQIYVGVFPELLLELMFISSGPRYAA